MNMQFSTFWALLGGAVFAGAFMITIYGTADKLSEIQKTLERIEKRVISLEVKVDHLDKRLDRLESK